MVFGNKWWRCNEGSLYQDSLVTGGEDTVAWAPCPPVMKIPCPRQVDLHHTMQTRLQKTFYNFNEKFTFA